MAREMMFDGTHGYFLTEDEYEDLIRDKHDEDEVEDLRIERDNLREVISQAYDSAHDLKYLLGNA